MALETVPLLREDSIVCWDLESVFKTAPATSPWQAFGRVDEWEDFGPRNSVFREAIAGAGREASVIGVDGVTYGPKTMGPWQVNDPRIMALSWGREVNAPVQIGATGYYRHTATPTNAGKLPSIAVQMADYKAGTRTDGTTFLGVIQPRLAVRGEATGEDGSGGRVLIAPTYVGHNDDPAIAAKPVTLPATEPYRRQHAQLQLFGADPDWRTESWEFMIDNAAKSNFYHVTSGGQKPYETPPEGVLYDVRFDIVADGHLGTGAGNRLIRDILRDQVKTTAQIKYVRTANQDEWAINLVDVLIVDAPKKRRKGKIHYDVQAHCRTTSFEWVDTNAARYLPA